MNRLIVILSIFVFMFLLIGSQSQSTMARDGGDFLTEGIYPSDPPETQSDGMPGWPVPEIPIPYHRPGHRSKAGNYSTQMVRLNAEGFEENITLTGLDALLADGVINDPLQGNYRLVKSTLGAGGGPSSSVNYQLRATLGQPSMIGESSSQNYGLSAGYWALKWVFDGLEMEIFLPLIMR